MKIKGIAHKYGNNIDTDQIIPARYLNTSDPKELAKHCLEDIDKNFLKKIKKGDILITGKNFGCGSSREHAPIAIKGAGISCIIAVSFARIFFRNAINIGLPILESEETSKNIKNGDKISIDLSKGVIKNFTRKENYKTQSFPPFIQKLIKAGGLMKYIKKQV